MRNKSFKRLKEIADDLNKSLYLNPPIDYVRTTQDNLLKQVRAAAEIIKPGDKIKQSTMEFLVDIGAEVGKSQLDYIILENQKKEEKKDKFSVYDCYGKDYDRKSHICEDCLKRDLCRREFRQKIAILKKMKGYVAFEGISGLEFYKYTRHHALIDALKIGGDKKEIIEMSNELFVRKGGEDNLKKAKTIFNFCTPALLIIKVLRKHRDFYLLKNL